MSDFQLIEADEAILIKNIMVVLYGEPNTTKTSLAFTANNPILLDFDEGVHRAYGRKTTVKFKEWSEVIKFMASNLIQERKTETIIIDTGGVMLDDFIALHAMKQNPANQKKGGGISQQGFGAVKDIYAKFQAECRSFGIDVVIVCHATDVSDGELMKKRPKMTGGSYDILKQKADLMGFMEMQNNEPVLVFSPTDRNVGKNSPNFPLLKIPHFSDPKFKTFLADIIHQTKEHLNAMSEEQRMAMQKVDNLNLQISDAIDITDLADIETEMSSLSKPLQVQIQKLYNEKYAVLWIKAFVKDTIELKEFNKLVKMANELHKDLQKIVKPEIVAGAKKCGYMVNMATKTFEEDPDYKKPEQEKSLESVTDSSSQKKVADPKTKTAKV